MTRPDDNFWTEKSIVGGIRVGDERAILKFSRESGIRLFRQFRAFGMDSARAEGLAVDCLGDIVMNIDKYSDRGAGSFAAWCYRFAKNRFLDVQRKNENLNELPLGDHLTVDAQRSEPVVSKKLANAVQRGLAKVSETHREILILRHYSGIGSFREIGDVLGITEGAARTRYHRARARIAEVLRGDPVIANQIGE